MAEPARTQTIRYIPAEPEHHQEGAGAARVAADVGQVVRSYQTIKVRREETLHDGQVVTQELDVYLPDVYLAMFAILPEGAPTLSS